MGPPQSLAAASLPAGDVPVASVDTPKVQRGLASWYGARFHGRRTASGESFDMNAFTAAHPRLPLGSYARVTLLSNGNSVVVHITDRGPYKTHRIIDLSRAAAARLGLLKRGVGKVAVQQVAPPDQVAAADPATSTE
jgi:rare lipoprotein A